MSDAAIMLRELAEPRQPGEYIKNMIDRAASLARLDRWRTFDIWYRKARRVEDYEIEQIQEALRIKNERAARNEFHELKTRLAKLEMALESRDPDFHCEDIALVRRQVRGPSVGNRTVDSVK